jgi:hypothetical protein
MMSTPHAHSLAANMLTKFKIGAIFLLGSTFKIEFGAIAHTSTVRAGIRN